MFFRQWVKDTADELGIAGLVRNEPDGSVHVLAEGGGEVLEKFITLCRSGPRLAQVERVETAPLKAEGRSGFIVAL